MTDLSKLTVEEASDIIMQAYRRKYTPKDEIEALALLASNARRIKPEYLLAKCLATEWLYEHHRSEYTRLRKDCFKGIGDYKRCLRNPNQILVKMIPSIERGWLLWRGLRMRRMI